MSWYLVMCEGPFEDKAFPLENKEITIGRAGDNNIIINESQVSRHHARLVAQGGGYVVEDLESSNGTWINSAPCNYPVMLQSNDTLQLGDNVVLVYSDSPQVTIKPKKVKPGDYKAREEMTKSVAQQGVRLSDHITTRVLPIYLIGAIVGITAIVAIILGVSMASRNTPTPTPISTAISNPTSTSAPMMEIKTKVPALPTTTSSARTVDRPFEIAVMSREYEPWGWPEHPGGCAGPYDEDDIQQRFTVKLVFTNNSYQPIRGDWRPRFVTNIGTDLPTCMVEFDDTPIKPGETKEVSFFTHLLKDKWVSKMIVEEADYKWETCLDEMGNQIECPAEE